MDNAQLIRDIQQLWIKLQSHQPLVHCITNSVASNFAANTLLAIGASPAMIDNPYESEQFARISGALSINTGTPTTEQTQAMFKAAAAAQQANVPWVLDPVGYGEILAWRSQTVDQLLLSKPNIIRGNASEISALAGKQSTAKGVDSTLRSDEVIDQARRLLDISSCVAISGATDYILSDEYNVVAIKGGSAFQPKVTAMGCALGAICAAYHAITPSSGLAAITAHAHFAVAAQYAEQSAQGIGSFQVAFMDALFNLREDDFNNLELWSI